MDVVDRDRGAVRAQGGDGDVAEPDGFFDQRAGGIVFTGVGLVLRLSCMQGLDRCFHTFEALCL